MSNKMLPKTKLHSEFFFFLRSIFVTVPMRSDESAKISMASVEALRVLLKLT